MAQHEFSAQTRARSGFPVRTCIGCRKQALAADLLRIVARQVQPEGWVLVPDPRRRLPGRGAWLHPDRKCLIQADKRRAFGRALRVSGSLDTAALDIEFGGPAIADPAVEPHPQQSGM
ncbi:YlxR family protein [Rhodococcus spelaei]|uniref:YlxR family protein n=1 Tax=Rhodococcus spelaei TaxID=2546320 RepID=A0A541B3W0_9NOCA|nr:YlxR family protein [Rhodococcus spelaei]TQF66994.1 YlxR family protein [Rhodococcus spelaei]